jgi:hypothetical protein
MPIQVTAEQEFFVGQPTVVEGAAPEELHLTGRIEWAGTGELRSFISRLSEAA